MPAPPGVHNTKWSRRSSRDALATRLLAYLVLLPLCGWACSYNVTVPARRPPRRDWSLRAWSWTTVVLPLYTGPLTARAALAGGAINYVRIRVVLLVPNAGRLGMIAEKGEGAYHAVSGRDDEGYAALAAVSAAPPSAGPGPLGRSGEDLKERDRRRATCTCGSVDW